MAKKIFAANWKCTVTVRSEVEALKKAYSNCKDKYDVILFPSAIHIQLLYGFALGAQDCSQFESGAYTGEVSAGQIKEMGADYVILGHSERRKYFAEGAEALSKKLEMAVNAGLKVVFCIGESLEEYENGQTEQVLESQLEVVKGREGDIILAYEPVWAIGTGKTPTTDEIDSVVSVLKKSYKAVLYGGSVSSKNIAEISENTSVDGFLVGGASAKTSEIEKILG